MSEAPSPHWETKARGGRAGNAFFVGLVRNGGMVLAPFFLVFVSLWFLLAAPLARRASFDLARRLGRARPWFAFRHFYTFGMLLLDRVAILGAGQTDQYRIEFDGEEHIRDALAGGKGAILLTAHLGNWEAMGHLITRLDTPFTMVMHDGIDLAMKATIEDMARDRSFAVLYTDGSPAAAAGILSALRAGHLVGMMGDRVFAGDSVTVPFLGALARFPVGAFVMAAASGAPVVHTFAVRRGWRRYSFHGFPGETMRYANRKEKQRDLERWAGAFAARVESFVRAHPWQWGNFYAFWD